MAALCGLCEGTPLVAGAGDKVAGIYRDLKVDSRRFAERIKMYRPDKENYKIYKKYANLYAGMLDRVWGIFVDLKNIAKN